MSSDNIVCKSSAYPSRVDAKICEWHRSVGEHEVYEISSLN